MNLADWTDDELAHRLRYQQADVISTWGPGLCGHFACGSGVCADCLQTEIQRRAALTQENDK